MGCDVFAAAQTERSYPHDWAIAPGLFVKAGFSELACGDVVLQAKKSPTCMSHDNIQSQAEAALSCHLPLRCMPLRRGLLVAKSRYEFALRTTSAFEVLIHLRMSTVESRRHVQGGVTEAGTANGCSNRFIEDSVSSMPFIHFTDLSVLRNCLTFNHQN